MIEADDDDEMMIDEKKDLTILLTLSLYTSPSHRAHALYVTSRVTPLPISIIRKKKSQSRHNYDTPPAQRLLSRVSKILQSLLFSQPSLSHGVALFLFSSLTIELWSRKTGAGR
jgi:hypothetical protein